MNHYPDMYSFAWTISIFAEKYAKAQQYNPHVQAVFDFQNETYGCPALRCGLVRQKTNRKSAQNNGFHARRSKRSNPGKCLRNNTQHNTNSQSDCILWLSQLHQFCQNWRNKNNGVNRCIPLYAGCISAKGLKPVLQRIS